jgi:transposase
MHIDIVPNRNAQPTILLRQSWREGRRIRKRTLANLSHWPREQIECLRRVLRGEVLVSPDDVFTIVASNPHGHVEALQRMIKRLALDDLLASRGSRERDLVLAMIAAQILHGSSKLATTRLWHTTTLAKEFGVSDADEEDLYAALDWLGDRQARIEAKLARRHLGEGSRVLYDVTSTRYHGRTCVLAEFGKDRDGKKGKRVIIYGVMTDAAGRPVALEVYPGDTGDPTTVGDQVDKLCRRFGLERVVLVGDRGMLTDTQIHGLGRYPSLGWISALRAPAVAKLVDAGHLQLSLFDETNLAEITAPDYPGERLIVCRNPLLAEDRRRTREELLAMTAQRLEKIRHEVARRTKTLLGADAIGLKVGRVINAYKVAKHFQLEIGDSRFSWSRNEASIAKEAALDGFYVIRTSEPSGELSAEETVRSYKDLSRVERLFRTLKGIELRVRPIRHRREAHVRGHIFLCMLAYYVEWHLRSAWAPLLFHDEELVENRKHRDPVAPAQSSESAQKKKRTRVTGDGHVVHSFSTLLNELGKIAKNECQLSAYPAGSTITRVTEKTGLHARAFELLEAYPVTL